MDDTKEIIYLATTKEGAIYRLQKNYRTPHDASIEDIVNPIEENDKEVNIRTKYHDKMTDMEIIGGKTELTKEKLMLWFTSTKVGKGEVGQMGEARWASFVFGVKEKIYEQAGKRFTLILPECSDPKQTNYTDNRVRTFYTYPFELEKDKLRLEILRRFAVGLYNNELKIKLDEEELNRETIVNEILPSFQPIINEIFEAYDEKFQLLVWFVDQANYKSPFPSPFLGLRASLKGITIQEERLGMTDRINHCFGFINALDGKKFQNLTENNKKHLAKTHELDHILRKATVIINNNDAFKKELKDADEVGHEMLKYLQKNSLSKAKCPKCGSSDLLPLKLNKSYKCKICGWIFPKKWTKAKGEWSGDGFSVDVLFKKIHFLEGYSKEKIFLMNNDNEPDTWTFNVLPNPEDSNSYTLKNLRLQYENFKKNHTSNSVKIFLAIIARVYIPKKILNNHEEILNKEWESIDSTVDTSLRKGSTLSLNFPENE